MINRNFKRDWKHYNGQIDLLTGKHLTLSVDKDYISFSLSISWRYMLIDLRLFNLVLTIY